VHFICGDFNKIIIKIGLNYLPIVIGLESILCLALQNWFIQFLISAKRHNRKELTEKSYNILEANTGYLHSAYSWQSVVLGGATFEIDEARHLLHIYVLSYGNLAILEHIEALAFCSRISCKSATHAAPVSVPSICVELNRVVG
jgi:hypothetical protein